MADRWALIAKTDNSWDGVALTEQPLPDDDHYYVFVPPDWTSDPATTGCTWNPAGPGWKDARYAGLITVGRFKLLLTKEERVAIRAAAESSTDVEDFLDLLSGFTDGVSLADPLLAGALAELQTAGLLTADRVTAILAGQTP